MAITTKVSSEYGIGLLKLFGVDPLLIEAASQNGIQITQHSLGLFAVYLGGKAYGTVSVKGSAITMAQSGQLGPASKQAIQYGFEEKIKAALKDAVDSGGVAPSPVTTISKPAPDVTEVTTGSTVPPEKVPVFGGVSGSEASEEALKKALQDLPPISKKVTTKMKKSASTFFTLDEKTANDLHQAVPCHLFEATECGVPVFGTSHGSVYYVLALLKGAALAARLKGDKLSLRLEPTPGKDLSPYNQVLDSFGFSFQTSHSSTHVSVGNKALLKKVVGALLFSLGMENVHESIDPITILGGGKLP